MVYLLFDKDVQSALLFFFFLFILYSVNDWKWKYKTNWRFWIGVIFVSIGLSGIFVNIFRINVIYFLAGFVYIVIGLGIWLIKAKKSK